MFKTLGVDKPDLKALAEVVIREYKTPYTELERNSEHIFAELEAEERTFSRTLNKGLKEVNKVLDELKEQKQDMMSGVIAFKLYDTYGFPLEITEELAKEQGVSVDREGFKKRELEHKEESKKGSDAKFAGGLLEDSIETRLLHTATHLLHEALNEVLGNHVEQKGSNITKERLRFDFTHPEKLTDEEKQKIEDVINEVIERDLEVTFEEMPIEEAIKIGAVALFSEKYDDIVKVYRVGDYSMEICGGPHANRSSELGHFKIIKEESAGKGIRRIRAVLTPNIK